MTGLPVLVSSTLSIVLYVGFRATRERPANFAGSVFLDPEASELYADWARATTDCVVVLHLYAGRHPEERAPTDLLGELSRRSDQFRQRCAKHDVRIHTPGSYKIHHPIAGDVTIAFKSMSISADAGQTFMAYTVESDSKLAVALCNLANWTLSLPIRP